MSPGGELLARTHKLHIPVTAGYYEDKFFRQGPDGDDAYEVHAPAELGGARLGMPTCWDEWFPELARIYSLGGAELLVYPTAIGSEPDHPDFDTQPLWQQVIVGNGIANGLFMVVPNRWGSEGTLNFYGSSFISDPYGRILAQAPRDESAVIVADLDLDQRRDWLTLFPFLATRRPDTYGRLTEPVRADAPLGSGTTSQRPTHERAGGCRPKRHPRTVSGWRSPPAATPWAKQTAEAHAARSVWAAVANAVVEFEPVTMLVAPADVQTAAATTSTRTSRWSPPP